MSFSSSSDTEKLRVLIVENEPNDFELAKVALGIGYVIQNVDGVGKAVQAIHDFKPDAILLDLDLQDSSRNKTLAVINDFSQRAALCVMTGHVDGSNVVAAYEAGAHDFIDKKDVSVPGMLKARLARARAFYKQQTGEGTHPAMVGTVEKQIGRATLEQAIENASSVRNLETAFGSALNSLESRFDSRLSMQDGLLNEIKTIATDTQTLAKLTNGRVGKVETWKEEMIIKEVEREKKLTTDADFGHGVRHARKQMWKLMGISFLIASGFCAFIAGAYEFIVWFAGHGLAKP